MQISPGRTTHLKTFKAMQKNSEPLKHVNSCILIGALPVEKSECPQGCAVQARTERDSDGKKRKQVPWVEGRDAETKDQASGVYTPNSSIMKPGKQRGGCRRKHGKGSKQRGKGKEDGRGSVGVLSGWSPWVL